MPVEKGWDLFFLSFFLFFYFFFIFYLFIYLFIYLIYLFCSPIICTDFRGFAPMPFIPKFTPLASSQVLCSIRTCHQRSIGEDERSLVDYLPKVTPQGCWVTLVMYSDVNLLLLWLLAWLCCCCYCCCFWLGLIQRIRHWVRLHEIKEMERSIHCRDQDLNLSGKGSSPVGWVLGPVCC